MHSRSNYRIGTNPHIIFNNNICFTIPLFFYRNPGIHRIMVRDIKRDIGTGLHIISNS